MFRPTGARAAAAVTASASSLGGVFARQRPQVHTTAAAAAAAAAVSASALRPSVSRRVQAQQHQQQQRRGLHHVPISRHDTQVGVPNLLSPEGFDLAWTQHMTLMLTRLNQLVAGTEYEDRDLKNILLETARMPSQAALFNHASMAHNTDFFFKQILPEAKQQQLQLLLQASGGDADALIPSPLRTAIEDSFGSVDTLRREFAATAAAMFGPGFVWLVKTTGRGGSGGGGGGSTPYQYGLSAAPNAGRGGSDNLRLLTTYLAGSPYPGAHYRRQAVDMNTVGAEPAAPADPADPAAAAAAAAAAADPARQWLDSQAAALGGGSPDRRPPGGVEVMPLLCLSTWEHVWLRDYGLGADGHGGKAAYVDAWWRVVDWEAVSDLASLSRPKLKT